MILGFQWLTHQGIQTGHNIISLVLALAVGWFGYVQYQGLKQDTRIERTLEQIRWRQGDPMVKASVHIIDAVDQGMSQIKDIPISAAERENAIAYFGAEIAKGIKKDLIMIISFYDSLWVCVDSKICDRDTALKFVGEESTVLWGNFKGYITEERKNRKNWANGLEQFAKMQGNSPSGASTGSPDTL
jgi:hypothetical protein